MKGGAGGTKERDLCCQGNDVSYDETRVQVSLTSASPAEEAGGVKAPSSVPLPCTLECAVSSLIGPS